MAKLVNPVEVAHSPPVLAFLGLFTHLVLHRDEWDNDINVSCSNLHHLLRLHPGEHQLTQSLLVLPLDMAAWFWWHCYSRVPSGSSNQFFRCSDQGHSNSSSHLLRDLIIERVGSPSAIPPSAKGTPASTLALCIMAESQQFPGPFVARFSKLHAVFAGVLPDYQYYKYSEALQRKYKTDVIRTGPRELAIYTADAVPLVHGPMSRCRKGTWYNNANHVGGASTHTTRDKQDHKQRRKAWDHAFNAKALREYEPRLNRHALALMTKLKEEAKKPSVRITNWVNFYSFDVMGDIGFSRSFGMVEKGEEDPMIKLLHASMEPLSVFGHFPWALNLITRTAAGAKPLVEHINWTAKVLKERKQVRELEVHATGFQLMPEQITPKENDIFSWLLDPNSPDVTQELNADSRLLVVAGSDTTAATLSFIAYEFCKNPDVQAKLRKAIDAAANGKDHLDVEDVQNIPYLDGVINEALRLHPAVSPT